mmetsp:Transcript_6043/g.10391  ORF Transcript_6043/g.10391 Transcript_6043/m.10391 type:complete len:210 (-) Transcript_6043:3-632(-)
MPRLTYFNGRGRAEIIRLMMAECGMDFEDMRINSREELKPIRDSGVLPFGQIPCLELEDLGVLVQSVSIVRLLARLNHYYGNDPVLDYKADMIVDGIQDLGHKYGAAAFATDDNKKASLLETFKAETLPTWLGYFQNILRTNNQASPDVPGYITGPDFTYADIVLFDLLDRTWATEALPAFEDLLGYKERVANRPNITAYLQRRPQTSW